MKLILIRHGESLGNVNGVIYGKTDYPLTPRGQIQSEVVQQRLENTKIDAVYASGTMRTSYMAQLIAKTHGLELQTDDRIQEMNYGIFEGLKVEEAKQMYGDLYQRYMNEYETMIIPEGEGYFQFRERVLAFLKDILLKEGTYVVITHGNVIRESLIYLLNLAPEQVWHYSIIPACLIQITYENGYGILEEIKRCEG